MDFKDKIIQLLKKETNLRQIPLEIPPSPELGDYSLPCFQLSSQLKKAPNIIAQELASKLKDNLLEKIEAKGSYLNFFINRKLFAELILKDVLKKKTRYGEGQKKKEIQIVEYFHANTHKGVHIGHIRNISIGEALCRILEKYGYKIIRANYQGDIGPHVAKCIWGYLNLKEKEPREKKGIWLGKIYALASKKAENNPVIEEEIRQINNKLYSKDKKIIAVWKKTRKYCLEDFNKFYNEFDVKFDKLYFESEVEKPGKKIVKNILKQGLAQESEGAIIMDLKQYNLGVYVLLTKDGNALYSTKDLGLAELKQKQLKFNKSIHITGAEQTFYFRQLFKTLDIIKSPLANKSLHVPYGLVMLPEGKMSSREGTMVLFDDLKQKLSMAAERAIKKRHKGLSTKEIKERTEKIVYSALKFSMVHRENNKPIVFDWETALNFEGETGPYIQYTHARICSILKKAKTLPKQFKLSNLSQLEFELTKKIALFSSIIEKSSQDYAPFLVARYALELSQLFNEFYHSHPILTENADIKNQRLFIIQAVKQVLENALELLAIESPEEM